MSSPDQQPKPARSALEKFLGLFSEVRAGEGAIALMLALNVFLILTAYYILKPVREALILAQGSAELKSYLSAGQVVLLALAVPLYARLAKRLPRRQLINWVTAFFVGCLGLFYLLAQAGVPLGIVFFLWIGIFNLMIVAQFWSFANDIYTNEQGERLFPLVAFGASLGAVLGAVIAGQLIEPLGVYQLMLVAAVLLIVEVQITGFVDRCECEKERDHLKERDHREEMENSSTLPCVKERKNPAPETPASAESRVGSGSFQLLLRNRYLLLIAFMLLLINWVNTTGEYILGSVVEDAARQAVADGTAGALSVEQIIGRFYANFFGVVNVVGLLIQLFLVSRIVKYLGVRFGVLILPILSLVAYSVLAFYPVLAAIRWVKTAENSTDYSLNNTVRNMLFLPTTRAEKYSAKQAIDSFFVRAGDVMSAALVFVGTTYLAMRASGFAIFNIGLVILMLLLAINIGKRYQQKAKESRA